MKGLDYHGPNTGFREEKMKSQGDQFIGGVAADGPNTHISSNFVGISIGGLPIGFLRNVVVQENAENIPIQEIGSPLVVDQSIGMIQVTVNGTLTLSRNMPIVLQEILPQTPQELVNQVLKGEFFIMSVYMKLPRKDGAKGYESVPPFMTVEGCRYTGSTTNIQANQPIVRDFRFVAQFTKSDWNSTHFK